MATSGLTTFTQTRDALSTDALILLGVYGQGDTPTTSDLTFCSNIMNKMLKAWEGQGLHLWTATEAAIFLTVNQQHYNTAFTDSDICGDYPVFDTLVANASGTSATVNFTTYMSVGQNIGIKLDANTLFWTTISAIPQAGVITLSSPLPSSASAGNNVFVFSSRTDRPLWITAARFRSSSGYERPLMEVGRTDFMNMPNKATTGKANQWFYSPAVSDSTLYVWPCADDVGDCITFSYMRRIQDLDNPTDNFDLPQEWLECITYNLAVRLAPSYGINTDKLNPDIKLIAQSSLQEMELWDSEGGSTKVVGNYRWDDER